MRRLLFFSFLLIISALLCLQPAYGRKRVSDRPQRVYTPSPTSDTALYMRGTVCVDSLNSSPGIALDSVIFTGFDKPASGDKETFLITNRGRLSLTAFTLQITYLTVDGRLLHRRSLTQQCFIPAGETRKIDIASFDRQGSYYYINSRPGRNGAYPFTVSFLPLRLYFLKR